MPANPKYLTTSKWARFAKLSAGLAGGFLVSASFHIFLGNFFSKPTVVVTSYFSGFLLWSALMILAFLSKNGWKLWGIYILFSLLFIASGYYEKLNGIIFK